MRELISARRLAPQTVMLPFLLHTVLVLGGYFLADYLPLHYPCGFINPELESETSQIVSKLIKWDAHWYTYIADYGYDAQNIVFFPLLVILIKMLTYTHISSFTAGLIISNCFAVLSFWAMAAVLSLDLAEPKVRSALFAYAVTPSSLFLNSIYTEGLFLTLSLACIYFTRCRKWHLAGFFAALASLTRNIGIMLEIFLVIDYWLASNKPRSLRFLYYAPLALLCFMVYNLLVTGNPLAFIKAQQLWGREFGLPWQNFYNNLLVINYNWPAIEPGLVLDAILVLLTFISLTILTFTGMKVSKTNLVIAWLWFLIPLLSTSPFFPLYSLTRFVLIIFPVYIFLAQIPSRYYRIYLIVSACTLVVSTALFINWYWIG